MWERNFYSRWRDKISKKEVFGAFGPYIGPKVLNAIDAGLILDGYSFTLPVTSHIRGRAMVETPDE